MLTLWGFTEKSDFRGVVRGGGFYEKPIYRGLPKKGGLGSLVFLRGADTPMHTV